MASFSRRRISSFNLSFLDIMACGFGAVTLLFLILRHSVVGLGRRLEPVGSCCVVTVVAEGDVVLVVHAVCHVDVVVEIRLPDIEHADQGLQFGRVELGIAKKERIVILLKALPIKEDNDAFESRSDARYPDVAGRGCRGFLPSAGGGY